jgi:transposase
MRKVKEILRLKKDKGLCNRDIALSCNVSSSTVFRALKLFDKSGLSWPLKEDLSESELDRLLYIMSNEIEEGKEFAVGKHPRAPDFEEIIKNLKRKHVTLRIVWNEYKVENPVGYQYSHFCTLYNEYCKSNKMTMRQVYRFGEKCFVDYAGSKQDIIDLETGEIIKATIFVGVLGGTDYYYSDAVLKCDMASWIKSHINMFEYFGGVPEVLVPDNLKTGVTKANYYEPDLNETYKSLANHYGAIILPARVRKPKDKAKVEKCVQMVEQLIIGGLRNRQFKSLAELNIAIKEVVARANEKSFQKRPGSRKELFEKDEKPLLKALPSTPFLYFETKEAKVHPDYHIEIQGNFYSVPYTYVGKAVRAMIYSDHLEIYHDGCRIAHHYLQTGKYKASTKEEHMPREHRWQLEWTPERFLNWGAKKGPHTKHFMQKLMESKTHPEQAFRACFGVLRLEKTYSSERLESACEIAANYDNYRLKAIEIILQKDTDKKITKQKQNKEISSETKPDNENLRGSNYYKQGKKDDFTTNN